METIIAHIQSHIKDVIENNAAESNYRRYIWFNPKDGNFLYNDCLLNAHKVQTAIEQSLIKFTGYHDHQGDKMARYSLNKEIS